MNLNSIRAFQDNYIWVLNNEQGKCVIVDPLNAHHWAEYLRQTLCLIPCTHVPLCFQAAAEGFLKVQQISCPLIAERRPRDRHDDGSAE